MQHKSSTQLSACTTQGRIQELSKGGRMASAGARAYNGGLGRSPQRGPGAEPLKLKN